MFDMSFSEIAVIGVVALVVLGPERLPKVARTAGHLFGRLQRYVATVKADINREMDTSELAKIKQEVQDAARSFEQTVQQHASSIEQETAAISHAVDPQPTPADAPVAPMATQNDMLVRQEAGMHEPTVAAPGVVPVAPAVTLARLTPTKPEQPMQASLDFGVEPTRSPKAT
jgi:sec-independent protein translocase protein TatB